MMASDLQDFPDSHAPECVLRAQHDSDSGSVQLYGWSYGADGFTSIDLAPDAVEELVAFLRASRPCSSQDLQHDWRVEARMVIYVGTRGTPVGPESVARFESYELVREVSVCGWCGRAAEAVVERVPQ